MWIKVGGAQYININDSISFEIDDKEDTEPDAASEGAIKPTGHTKRVISLRRADSKAFELATLIGNGEELESQTAKFFKSFETALEKGAHFWDVPKKRMLTFA